MSWVIRSIVREMLRDGGDQRLSFAACDLTADEDRELIRLGILKKSPREQTHIICPFGCGEIERILILPKPSGGGDAHYVICTQGNGTVELTEDQYAIYDFDPFAALPHIQLLKSMTEEEKLDAARKTVLIKPPDGTLKDTKRFIRELSTIILITHANELNLHTLLESVLWIFGRHNPDAPFYNECIIAEKLLMHGRKKKSPYTMYQYARQGTAKNPTVLKLLRKHKQELKIRLKKEELSDIAKIDPRWIE